MSRELKKVFQSAKASINNIINLNNYNKEGKVQRIKNKTNTVIIKVSIYTLVIVGAVISVLLSLFNTPKFRRYKIKRKCKKLLKSQQKYNKKSI